MAEVNRETRLYEIIEAYDINEADAGWLRSAVLRVPAAAPFTREQAAQACFEATRQPTGSLGSRCFIAGAEWARGRQ